MTLDVTGHRVSIDVGGTFIDLVHMDESTGEMWIEKQPSTPDRLVQEVLAGIMRLRLDPERIGRIFHGTTAGINALVQERGARVGLITTEGFRDALELGRGRRPHVYDATYRPPEPLVPRYLRRSVAGRIAADGQEVESLDLAALDREMDELIAEGVEAVAVCFLNSYVNPAHEREAANRIRARHPTIPVSTSYELVTEWREFERTSTTVLNAYIQPLLGHYVEQLHSALYDHGAAGSLGVMQSNGGVMSVEATKQRPIRTLMSGPAGGVIGAQWLAAEIGRRNIICADVGGTTYDVALIEDGEILETTETEVGSRPIVGSIIDIVSIGAGGGSIAWLDEAGAIKVGPQSAGATPGPACYAQGGVEPTVTDCQLILGRLDADNFLGARMRLDRDAAIRALAERVADQVGVAVEDAALGVMRVAETNMVYAIRTLTVERGIDPRDFALCSYGGGGGLFAAAVAEELDIPTVVVPRAPANFSAVGIMLSDYRTDASVTRIRAFESDSLDDVVAGLEAVAARVQDELAEMGFGTDEIELMYRMDGRFVGQDDALTIRVESEWLVEPEQFLAGYRRRFVETHQQLFGYGDLGDHMEVVNYRCRGLGGVPHPPMAAISQDAEPAKGRVRMVRFSNVDQASETPVYERESLAAGTSLDGPAVIEEWTTTLLVPPGWGASIDEFGNVIMQRVSA